MKRVPFRLDDQRRPQEQMTFKMINLGKLKVRSYLCTLGQTHYEATLGALKVCLIGAYKY